MARKNRRPEENERRAKIRELLQASSMDDELGSSKYDYKNKDTDNSRNGHSSKMLAHQLWRCEGSRSARSKR